MATFPLQAGATFMAGSGGAAGAAAMSNPITAAITLAALATAYGASPTVRNKTNKVVKKGWEGITNPVQHFGDGSSKDTMPLSKILNAGLGDGQMDNSSPGGLGSMINMGKGFLQNKMQQGQQNKQQQQQNVFPGYGGYGGLGGSSGIAGLNPSIPRPAVPYYSSEQPPNQFFNGMGLAGMRKGNYWGSYGQ